MLSPYRVLDLADERGLLCGQILADLGADVIAIESPGGSSARRVPPFAGSEADPEASLTWWAYSRGKRSVTLDLDSPAGQSDLKRLVASADILIESAMPGTMAARGLGYADLAAINPGLVYVSISAFGQEGPKASWAATDLTIWASGGTMPTVGDDDRAPLRISVPQGWLHAGACAAVGAIVALYERGASGLGQHVDSSAQAAVAMTTMSQILTAAYNTPQPGRGGRLGLIRTLYETKDGYAVLGLASGAQSATRSSRLMNLIYSEGFCDEEIRDIDFVTFMLDVRSGKVTAELLERLTAAIDGFMRSHTKEELFRTALELQLWLAPVNTMADVAASVQLEAREYWRSLEGEGGRHLKSPGPFIHYQGQPPAGIVRPPAAGEHTAAILGEPRPPLALTGTGASRLPLEGIKILNFTWVMAAPQAIRMMSDWGATIVHIESTKRLDLARTSFVFKDNQVGLEQSGWWQNLGMGKKSFTLDLGRPEARDIVFDLVRWANVVAESYAPGQMARWGFTYDAFRAVNPEIVMLSSALLGQTGPHSRYSALGTQASPLMGFWDVTGWPDRLPTAPTGAYTNLVAPWFTAAALVAALDNRRRTHEGRYLDFGQGEAALQFLAPAILDQTVNGHLWTRMGNDDLAMAPHGAYPAAGEDRWVVIACRDDADWQRLCAVIGRPELANDPRFATAQARLGRRRELDDLLTAWTRDRDELELQETLQAVGVPAHRVQNSAECLADPQLASRGHFLQVEHPIHGPVTIERTRFRLSRSPDAVDRHGPMMGEHNEQVLSEILGYSDDRVAEIVASGLLE